MKKYANGKVTAERDGPVTIITINRAEDGMPLGLQLLGYMNRDAELFAAAAGVLPLFNKQ